MSTLISDNLKQILSNNEKKEELFKFLLNRKETTKSINLSRKTSQKGGKPLQITKINKISG